MSLTAGRIVLALKSVRLTAILARSGAFGAAPRLPGLKTYPILPDGFAGSILRAMRPALRQGRYGEALYAAAETIGNTVAQSKHVSLNAQLPRRTKSDGGGEIPIGWLFFGGILLLILLSRRRPRGYGGYSGSGGDGGLWTGMVLGNVLTRGSWGSRGSGGFGGFDSGDSFGGFGGGDSGGGGASSDW